jgi:hypothetical protein
MKRYRAAALVLAVTVVCVFASRGFATQYSADSIPAASPELDKALGDESLLAAAQKTNDGKTLLGLARFASPEARAKIVERVKQVSPADAPAAAALMCAFSPDTEVRPEDVDIFLKTDGDNGVPFCLTAGLLLKGGKTTEAIEELKKGLAMEKFETYDKPDYRKGIISALDLLGLSGEIRLFALQRAITSRVNPPSQAIYWSFINMAQGVLLSRPPAPKLSAQEQVEVSDLMIKLGGKLLKENGSHREGDYCGFFVLGAANGLRAAAATDMDLKRAYITMYSFVGAGSQAQDLPQADIYEALTIAGTSLHELRPFNSQYYSTLAPADKAKVDEALTKVQEAGRTLVGLMAPNPDEIAGVAVVSDLKSAHEATFDHPKVREAMQRVLDASESATELFTNLCGPIRSRDNLKKIGLAMLMYSNDYRGAFPPDLKTLRTAGYLQKGTTLESPITGKPYVYLGAKMRDDDNPSIPVAYDDTPVEAPDGDRYVTLYVDGHTMLAPASAVGQGTAGGAQ